MEKSRLHNRTGIDEDQHSPLAYRLRSQVQLDEKKDAIHLCLSYPLKYVSLNLFWQKAMRMLSKGDFIGLDDLLSTTGRQDPVNVELFLNDLVRKGFLERKGIAAVEAPPFVSVIIPVYNRSRDIAACLESLLKIDYPEDRFEIIVVDDASTDDTTEVVSRYPVSLIVNPENRQAPHCRNQGAARARGDLLAFIDSDCQADMNWLQELVPVFKDLKIAAVGGIVESYYHTRPLDRYEQVRSSLKMGLWPRRSASNNPFFYVPSCNLLVRREVFIKIRGFDESLVVGEDVDLCWRMREKGMHIDYLPSGRVFHKHRNRIAAFCRRRFDYGTSEPLLNRLYPGKVKQMKAAPPAILFWTGLTLALVLQSILPLVFSGSVLFCEAVFICRNLKQSQISLPLTRIALAVARKYAAFIYHCSAFFSRYYLIWLPMLIMVLPFLSLVLTGMHILNALVEYGLKKPRLDPIRFLVYFTMEQVSYQAGVWWQSLKLLSFRSVNPRITTRIVHES